MWKIFLCCFVCVCFSAGCCLKEQLLLPTPKTLPEQIFFRTRTETFNKDYFLFLYEGRIWYKRKRPSQGETKKWRLLGRTGLPEGCDVKRFPHPQRLVSLSADGIHLQALGDNGVIYRATNLRENIDRGMEWSDSWGWPMAIGPGLRSEFGLRVIWDVADAHTFDLKYYEDANGTRHHIGLGVAHIYMLALDGKKIYYNDWWLPADWSRQVCGPRRGTFQAIQMSVSGSTLFVINQRGEMFTRLYDFDVSGENPFLTYTFVQKKPPSNVRRIPIPDWHPQPLITAGRITSKITIFQDGEGNAARTLRVEGEKNGKTGFFQKKIFEKRWLFQETGHTLTLPFSTPSPTKLPSSQPTNPEDGSFLGTLTRQEAGKTQRLHLRFKNFHIICSPAQVEILISGKPLLKTNGKPFLLTFHHVHTMVTQRRRMEFWKKGEKAPIRAALLPPSQLKKIAEPHLRHQLRRFFGDLSVINLSGEATTKQIEMRELTRAELFRVPDEEKGHTSRFTLSLHSESQQTRNR
jgi:hypothetical protein